MHKAFGLPQEFLPSFSCGVWVGLDSGVPFVCLGVFFHLFLLHVVVELSFCYVQSRAQECVSFSRLENAQRYNQVLPQYLIIHN